MIPDNLCIVCEDKMREHNAELCNLCLNHVKEGNIFFLEIKNGSQDDPKRTGKIIQVKREEVEKKVLEPMRSIILTLGFSFVTTDMIECLQIR